MLIINIQVPEVTEKVKVKRKGTLVKDSKQKESKKEGEFLSLESPAQDNKVIKVCFKTQIWTENYFGFKLSTFDFLSKNNLNVN